MTLTRMAIRVEFEDNRPYTAELSKQLMQCVFKALTDEFPLVAHIGVSTDWTPGLEGELPLK